MPFVAICPYCRAGGVRAPDSAAGLSATCPRCRSNFTICKDEPPFGRTEPTTTEVVRPVAETGVFSTAADVTEPSPVLADSPPATRPAPPPPSADTALVAGLVGLLLFGLGVAATLLPYGRVIGLGACGVGLLVGLSALGGEGRARITGAAAGVLNLVAVALLLLAPTWLGLQPWRGGEEEEEPAGPAVVMHGGGGERGNAGGVIPADRASWTHDDLRVTVRPAVVGPVELVDALDGKKRTRESCLQLTVRLTNTGVKRKIDLSEWAAGESAGLRLTDPAGRPLARKTFEAGWRPAGPPRATGLTPGNPADVVFVFEPPPPRTEYLRLELAGSAVGEPGMITFRLPGPTAARRAP